MLTMWALPTLLAAMRTASFRTISPTILFGRLPPLDTSRGAAAMPAMGLGSAFPAALLVVAPAALGSNLGTVRMLRLALFELRHVWLYGLALHLVRIKIRVLRVFPRYVIGIDRRWGKGKVGLFRSLARLKSNGTFVG